MMLSIQDVADDEEFEEDRLPKMRDFIKLANEIKVRRRHT
jgi:hypothetical protein